jgi:hypothetical protein
VWRITAEAPLGELVEIDERRAVRTPVREPSAEPEVPPERSGPGFHQSTGELLAGVEVTDETDTMPGDLFEALFLAPKPAAAPGSAKKAPDAA